MLDIMKNGENAMKAFEGALRIQTANMGNLSTVGYKGLKYSFKTIFNKVLNTGSAGSTDLGGTNPYQEGSSVSMANITVDFSQGEIGSGTSLDLALKGAGMFMVTPDEGKTVYYSRAGNFKLNSEGFLQDNSGRKVYGFKYANGQPDTSKLELIKLDNPKDAGWQSKGFQGILVEDFQTSSANPADLAAAKPAFQIALTDFPNRGALIQHDGTTYRATPAAGIPFTPGQPAVDGYAEAISQATEKSNVFFIGETVDAMEIQRAMSASLTAVKIASQQIQNIVQQLGS